MVTLSLISLMFRSGETCSSVYNVLTSLEELFQVDHVEGSCPPAQKESGMRTQRGFFAQVWDQAEDFLLAFISVSLLKWNWMNLVYLCLSVYLAIIFIVLYGLPTGSNWASPVWQVPQFELRLRAWHFQNTFEERWET